MVKKLIFSVLAVFALTSNASASAGYYDITVKHFYKYYEPEPDFVELEPDPIINPTYPY